ncbi:MAG: porin family protein [Chitinophagales bacterium]
MKNTIMLIGLLSLFLALQAQNTVAHADQNGKDKKKKEDFYFDAYGGLNISSMTGSGSSNTAPLVGGQVGVGATILDFSQVIGLRAELAFSMQGGTFKSQSTGGYSTSSSGHTRLNYINVPILGRYQSPGGFYGEFGVQPGFLVSAKETYSGGSYDLKSQMNGFDFGILFGGGYKFKNKIGVGIRIVPGVTNLRKNESTGTSSYSYTEHNFVGSIRGSYSF